MHQSSIAAGGLITPNGLMIIQTQLSPRQLVDALQEYQITRYQSGRTMGLDGTKLFANSQGGYNVHTNWNLLLDGLDGHIPESGAHVFYDYEGRNELHLAVGRSLRLGATVLQAKDSSRFVRPEVKARRALFDDEIRLLQALSGE